METPTEARKEEVRHLLQLVSGWAAGRPEICAVALVGSWTGDRATMTSDVDLVVLSDEPGALTQRDLWWSFLGAATLVRTRAWGIVVERRLRLSSGLEVEFAIAPRTWALLPLDAGTRGVLSAGARSLFDPEGLLRSAIEALGAS